MSKSNLEQLSLKVEKPIKDLLNKILEQNSVKQKECISLSIVLFALESGTITIDELYEYLPGEMNNLFDLADRTVNRRQHKEIVEQNKSLYSLLKSFRPDRPSDEDLKDWFAQIKLRDGDQFDMELAASEIQNRKGNGFRSFSPRDKEILRSYYTVFRDEIDKKVLELKRAS
jgi:hypothetical protein